MLDSDEQVPAAEFPEQEFRVEGYLVGNRFIPDQESRHLNYMFGRVHEVTHRVFLVEPGLERFSRVRVVVDREGRYIFEGECFPFGPEDAVRNAFLDRKDTSDIKGVPPALDLAFSFASRERERAEERRAELERIREQERLREEAERNMGTGAGRRALAQNDFEAAARSALAIGGAEYLDSRPGYGNEMIVQYRLDGQRFECVAERDTMRIVDSGICLTDEYSGEKGDTYFTLESLPSVVQQAIRESVLVVYRHVD